MRPWEMLQTYWNAWLRYVAIAQQQRRYAGAYQSLHNSGDMQKILAQSSGRDLRIQRLVHHLESFQRRWHPEKEWRRQVASDPALHAMFCRFATTFDDHRGTAAAAAASSSSSSTRALSVHSNPLVRAEAFDSVLQLIWTRQQLSVALSRLKGESRSKWWRLGLWPLGLAPLLFRENFEYLRVTQRLPAMIRRVEDERLLSNAFTIVQAARLNRETSRTPSMWIALADLLVVHHPDWQSRSQLTHGILANSAEGTHSGLSLQTTTGL